MMTTFSQEDWPLQMQSSSVLVRLMFGAISDKLKHGTPFVMFLYQIDTASPTLFRRRTIFLDALREYRMAEHLIIS
jgi:hypothetical protein